MIGVLPSVHNLMDEFVMLHSALSLIEVSISLYFFSGNTYPWAILALIVAELLDSVASNELQVGEELCEI